MRNLKRALSLGLTAAMISGLMVMGSSAASYADVTSENNVEAIEVLEAVGIMIGDENGDFNPDQNVTRNEMAVVMSNLMEYNVASYANTSPFTDVPSWAEPYVAACWTNGITAGTSATTYGGSDNVTTSQAALMLMKALGYFQYSQDFGNDWQLATATKGNDIDLFNGVDSGLREAMTRNDLAQLVLNTLESGTVQASTSGSITVGGVTIATDVQYNYVTSNAGYARSISTEKSTTNTTDAQSSIVELGEDLYQGDLTKTKDHDAFGRPAAIWAYQDDEIGTYVDDRTQTWTTKVSERDLYRAAGTAAVNDYSWTYWINGDPTSMDGSKLDRNDTDRWQSTGNGVLTEMFVDTVNETVDVTIIHSYVAEVSRVRANDDDNDYTITVNYKTRPASGSLNREFNSEVEFAQGDIVIVNVADGTIEAMTLAETVEGTVTSAKANDRLSVDDAPYNYNYAYTVGNLLAGYSDTNKGLYDLENSTPANPGAGDEVVLYLDTNGTLVAVAEAGEVAEDYIYVKGAHELYGDYSARVVRYDGTQEDIDIDEVDGTDVISGNFKAPANYTARGQLGVGVYKFARSGNAYDLTSSEMVPDEFDTAQMTSAKIENGRARIGEYDSDANSYSGATWAVDSNTVFVDAHNNVSYIGYQNVPTMNNVQGWVVFDDSTTSGVADIVFITNEVEYEADNDSFFLYTGDAGTEEYNEDGNVWVYTVYINGAEETITSPNRLSLDMGVYEIKSYDSDGNVTDVDPILYPADILNAGATSTAYATYAQGISLTVGDGSVSDKSVSINHNNRFTIDDETQFVVAYLNEDGDDIDDDSIVGITGSGGLSDINVFDDNNPIDNETSAVYILNVDDSDEIAPTAKLVLVINPDPESTTVPGGGAVTPGTIVTPLTVNESALSVSGDVYANASTDDVKAAAGNALIDAGWTITGYGNVSAVDTDSSTGNDTFAFTVSATRDGVNVTFNASLKMAYTVYLNDQVLEKVYEASGSFTPNAVNSTTNTTIANAAGTRVIISRDNKATWTDENKATGLTASAITKNVYIETGYVDVTGVPGVSYAEAGKTFVIAANTIATDGTGYTYQIGAGDPVYQASNRALRIDGANVTGDITITTDVYRVSGDIGNGDGYVTAGTTYTVGDKDSRQGTGVKYTMDDATGYAAYGDSAVIATVNADITIEAGYVKVTVSASGTVDDFAVTTTENTTAVDANAETTYVKVGSTITVANVDAGGAGDTLYAKIADSDGDITSKTDITNLDDQITGVAKEKDITVTIADT